MTRGTKTKWTLASVALTDGYTDFILSRQAMQCSPATLQFYRHTAGAFLKWIELQGVTPRMKSPRGTCGNTSPASRIGEWRIPVSTTTRGR